MEKRTLLAVALSMVVITGFYLIYGIFFPAPQTLPDVAAPPPTGVEAPATPGVPAAPVSTDVAADASEDTPAPAITIPAAAPAAAEPAAETAIIETDVLRAVFSNAGGDLVSLQLKKHDDKGTPVDMVLAGSREPHAFTVTFGSRDDLLSRRVRPVDARFQIRRLSDYAVEFSRVFVTPEGGAFTLAKRYEFKPGEYLFELSVTLDAVRPAGGAAAVAGYDFDGAAYTLAFGPQFGPRFEKLDQRSDYRRYLTYKGKLKTERVTDSAPTVITTQPIWAAIEGKYFTLICLPLPAQYEIAFSTQAEPGLPAASRLLVTRPAVTTGRVEDKYQFYLGPKNQETLSIYETGVNAWKLTDTGILNVAATKGFLAPLEKALKWLLMLFYRIIPNYGVAILLLTLFVKAIMFPLTKKGSESTLRMQTLAPRIKEIQEKYKDNPQKMNVAMAEFYKKEGYNPLSGCLPMLIQLPIFLALYNLFSNHFDLRGAMFIPGWIPDLSLPESVFNFAPFRLPILGWSDIRLLPFIYVGSQLLYGKVTQTPDQQGNAQMKIMLYAMPIIFFFVLYDMPSGLLVYWIMSNILTMAQQITINKYIARKKAALAAGEPLAEPRKVIAPPPRKRRKK